MATIVRGAWVKPGLGLENSRNPLGSVLPQSAVADPAGIGLYNGGQLAARFQRQRRQVFGSGPHHDPSTGRCGPSRLDKCF